MKTFLNLKTIKTVSAICIAAVSFTSCSDSDNEVEIDLGTKILFTSNNDDGNVNTFNVGDINSVTRATLNTSTTAADGIYYDSDDDLVVQASRSSFGLEGYSDISLNAPLVTVNVNASVVGTTDMSSPREVAVNNDFYVVADNADVDGNADTPDGRLFVYVKEGNRFTLRNTITTDIKLWGIIFIGNDLYAVADATNRLAVYNNFLSNSSDATLAASKTIAAEGIVRTHGLTYDAMTDTMILTDIGAASNGQDDGGFHVISNFSSKFRNTADGATLAVGEQTRVSGSNTMMGNPVDVAFDGETGTVFIAEAGNNGGRILAFNNINTGGNLTPVYNASLAKASAVYLHKE